MKNLQLIIILISSFLISCGGVKKTKNSISSGDYDNAFENAIKRLKKDKNKNAKQIPLLKEAFDKANNRDVTEITNLKNRTDAQSLKRVYKKYMQMDVRQDEVILLKPLSYDGKVYNFPIKDYSKKIAVAKTKYSDKIYATAQPLMNNSKANARKAFLILEEIQVINPNYRTDLNNQILQVKKGGMDYVFIKLHNSVNSQLQDSTSQSILNNFIDIRTGDFDNKWVTVHNKKDYSISYDYQTDVFLDKITAIPEKTNSQVVAQEKDVQTGWNYKLDGDGNRVKDAEGNDIRTAKMEKIKATVTLYQQVKSTILDGKVSIKNLKTGKIVNATPLNGEAKLENLYGIYKGDPKAIEEKYHEALQKKKAKFPEDSAFNKFALQTFKQKVEMLIGKLKF